MSAITVEDVSGLIAAMAAAGCPEKTTANALACRHSVLRFALRRGWIVDDPIAKLEHGERPRPEPRVQRVLGRDEVARLLACCADRYRPLVATALYPGMRISELLGLVWDDVDLDAGTIHVRAQLSPAHRGVARDTCAAEDARRFVRSRSCRSSERCCGRTAASPATPGLATGCSRRRQVHRWGIATPSVVRLPRRRRVRAWKTGACRRCASTNLRHTFASHLIVDLGLDVAQVSRILGHAQITTTLSIYTHLFEHARHAHDVKARMAASPFVALLQPTPDGPRRGRVVALPKRNRAGELSARERAALRWGT